MFPKRATPRPGVAPKRGVVYYLGVKARAAGYTLPGFPSKPPRTRPSLGTVPNGSPGSVSQGEHYGPAKPPPRGESEPRAGERARISR